MLLLSLLFACNDPAPIDTTTPPPPPRDTGTSPVVYAPLEAGAPLVGAAEGDLELPIGTPLGGFTARCKCLLGFSTQDIRDSMYANGFVPSTGVQTYPGIKVIWLANGDDHLVITKTDSIYSFDGLVGAITERLERATGVPLDGRVIHTANHSHSSFGTFSDAPTFYLGGDTLVRENFDRMADQIAEVALEAYDELEPGRVGVGWGLDWDPNDEVYRDRRGENNELHVWPDAEPGMGKDPHLGLIRVDDAQGRPLAMVVNFGMHGIIGSESSPMVSTDSGGHLETYLEESFDHEVVVMFAQGSGGDASPAGRGSDFAKMESIGLIGTDKIRDVFDQVPYGGLFCGEGSLSGVIGSDIGSSAPEYEKCADVADLAPLVELFFGLEEESFPLPLPETQKAATTVTRLGPVPTLRPDGTVVTEDLLLGFFPGEATAMYGEQWRRRVRDELGDHQAMMISYAQDHEGYLLIPEDWLLGGYEPDITVWGPLAAEHTMEGALLGAKEVLGTTLREDPDPEGIYTPTTYPDRPLETYTPDPTPRAGTRITEPLTGEERLWTWYHRDGQVPAEELVIPSEVPRVQGVVQLAWEGGDPSLDNPAVTIEVLGDDGTWSPLTSRSGRVITEGDHDVLLGYTPHPLAPWTELQEHRWWATWQAVGHVHDRLSLPLGTYRVVLTRGFTVAPQEHLVEVRGEPGTRRIPHGALEVGSARQQGRDVLTIHRHGVEQVGLEAGELGVQVVASVGPQAVGAREGHRVAHQVGVEGDHPASRTEPGHAVPRGLPGDRRVGEVHLPLGPGLHQGVADVHHAVDVALDVGEDGQGLTDRLLQLVETLADLLDQRIVVVQGVHLQELGVVDQLLAVVVGEEQVAHPVGRLDPRVVGLVLPLPSSGHEFRF